MSHARRKPTEEHAASQRTPLHNRPHSRPLLRRRPRADSQQQGGGGGGAPLTSMVLGLLVAATTTTWLVGRMPSISVSSCDTTRFSSSPPALSRRAAMESISSMKMMAGAFFSASSNAWSSDATSTVNVNDEQGEDDGEGALLRLLKRLWCNINDEYGEKYNINREQGEMQRVRRR
jgi:hypothetical protein